MVVTDSIMHTIEERGAALLHIYSGLYKDSILTYSCGLLVRS